MKDGERFEKFHADFEKLKRNREKVPLSQLQTRYAKGYNALLKDVRDGADWFADAYIKSCGFPRHPDDKDGNEWLDKKMLAILLEENRPGGLVERYRAALLEQLDMEAFYQLVWERYDRLEKEAFIPYWRRHCRWRGKPGNRWIYNDIFKKFWWSREKGNPGYECWINKDHTGFDYRYPPNMKEET